MTSIIQPMDQGVLENLKRRYKRELLRKLLLDFEEDVSFMEFCKKLTIKSAVYLSAKCWEEISSTSLCRTWNKLFTGRKKLDDQPPSEEFPLISEEFGPLEISECEMEEWLTADQDVMGFQELSDVDLVQESPSPEDDTDEEEEQEKCVSRGDAEQCFDTCFKWLEQHPEATTMNLMLLRNLHSLASRKRHSSLKQRKITSYMYC